MGVPIILGVCGNEEGMEELVGNALRDAHVSPSVTYEEVPRMAALPFPPGVPTKSARGRNLPDPPGGPAY